MPRIKVIPVPSDRNGKERKRNKTLCDSYYELGCQIGLPASTGRKMIIDRAIEILQENEEKQKKAQLEIGYLKMDLEMLQHQLREAWNDVQQLQNMLKSVQGQQQLFPMGGTMFSTESSLPFHPNRDLSPFSLVANKQNFYPGNCSTMSQQGLSKHYRQVIPVSRSNCLEKSQLPLQMSQPMMEELETGRIQNGLFSHSQTNNMQQNFYAENWSMMSQQGFPEYVYPTPPDSRASSHEEPQPSLQMSQPMEQQQESGVHNDTAIALVPGHLRAHPSGDPTPSASPISSNARQQPDVLQTNFESPESLQNSVISSSSLDGDSPLLSSHEFFANLEEQFNLQPACAPDEFNQASPSSTELTEDEFAVFFPDLSTTIALLTP